MNIARCVPSPHFAITLALTGSAGAGLAEQADPLDRALHAGRLHRPDVAPGRPEGRRRARRHVVFENKPGRERHHRHRRRREGGARRLHLRHRDRRACRQCHAQSEASLRHAEGFHLRLADELRAADHHREQQSLPANNIQELIALAKSKPGELSFASSGVGAAAHLTMEMFKSRMGTRHGSTSPTRGPRGAAGHGRRATST